MLFKPSSPHWLLPFCNARGIVAKQEKPRGQECHPAHRQGEEVREAWRGSVQPDHQLGMVLRPGSFDDALECRRVRRCDHAPLFSRIRQPQGFSQLSPRIGWRFRRRDQELKSRAVPPGKVREIETEQAEEGDPSMGVALELIIPIIGTREPPMDHANGAKPAGFRLDCPFRRDRSRPTRTFRDKPPGRSPDRDGGDRIHASIGSEMRNGGSSGTAFELARHEPCRDCRSRCDRVPDFLRCTGDIHFGFD